MNSLRKFSLIVAINNDALLGIKEYNTYTMPWPMLKEDIDFFRKTTTSTSQDNQKNAIIVGYNTWLSLPPIYRKNIKRLNIIISRTDESNTTNPGTEKYVNSFAAALEYASCLENINKIFVIGGAAIYNMALSHPLLETIYLTHIKHSYPEENIVEQKIYFPLGHQQFNNFVDNGSLKLIHQCADVLDIGKNISFCFKTYIVADTFAAKYQSITKNQRIVLCDKVALPISCTDGEYQYLNLVETIMDNGIMKKTRNAITRSIFGYQLRYDLADGYPLSTVKRSYPKAIFEELMWMIRGQTNVKKLQEKNVHIWDKNSTKEFLEKNGLPYDECDIGPGYGFQMRHFGASYTNCLADYTGQGFDQIQECINLIKTDPHSRRIIINLWNAAEINKMSLPPCFLPGTLVLTNRGYIEIENVVKKDLLLSHTGIMRKINKLYKTQYDGKIYNIKTEYHPHIIKCTPEHPFFVKKSVDSDTEWVNADKLKPNYFIGCPINKNEIIPTFSYTMTQRKRNGEPLENQIQLTLDNEEYWFMMGYYVGDGWLDWNGSKYRFYFVFNENDMKTSYLRIREIVKLSEVKTSSTGCRKFEGRKFDWWNLLQNFGHLAHGKKIPEWVQDAPKKFIRKFIEGYIAADGCKTNPDKLINATTVSPHLAFGFQRLFLKLGRITSVRYYHMPETHVIQGRIVNQRNLYVVDKNLNDSKYRKSFIEGDYAWFNIYSIEEDNVDDEYVYNFDVETDHSYIVENLATHNCHVMYNFGVDLYANPMPTGKRGKLNCHLFQRSWDVLLGWNTTTAALLTYIMAHHCDLDPGVLVHSISDAHLYKEHIDSEAVFKLLNRIPRKFPTIRFLNKYENIDDYKFEDVVIENYYPCPSIIAEMIA